MKTWYWVVIGIWAYWLWSRSRSGMARLGAIAVHLPPPLGPIIVPATSAGGIAMPGAVVVNR